MRRPSSPRPASSSSDSSSRSTGRGRPGGARTPAHRGIQFGRQFLVASPAPFPQGDRDRRSGPQVLAHRVPSISGRPRSKMTRSGVEAAHASAPVPTRSTTKPSRSSPSTKGSAIASSSSTTSTRTLTGWQPAKTNARHRRQKRGRYLAGPTRALHMVAGSLVGAAKNLNGPGR
jgi:hypothetical protein